MAAWQCLAIPSLLYVCVLSAQFCPTFHDPMDCSPSGSFVHEISQARILAWVVISWVEDPGDLPNPGIEPPVSLWQVNSLPPSHLGIPYYVFGLVLTFPLGK